MKKRVVELINSVEDLDTRKLIGKISRWCEPNRGWCCRCGIVNNWTTFAMMNYEEGHSRFLMCKTCWDSCSVDERLEYWRYGYLGIDEFYQQYYKDGTLKREWVFPVDRRGRRAWYKMANFILSEKEVEEVLF